MKNQFAKFLDGFEELVCAIAMGTMLCLAFANVISRYFIHSSISFTEEITTGLFVLLCTMGSAIAAKRGLHLGLSILPERLSRRNKLILQAITNLISGIFSLVLFYTSSQMVFHQKLINSRTTTLQWPAWLFGLALPAGALFIIIRFLSMSYMSMKKLKLESQKEGLGGND